MFSSDSMFEASPVYFEYVNKCASCSCKNKDDVSVGVNLDHSKPLISLVVGMVFDYWGFMNEN